MKTNILSIIIFMVLYLIKVPAQEFIQPGDTNFSQIEARYKTLPVDTGWESEYMQYQRFRSDWMPRLAPSYSFKPFIKAYKSFYQTSRGGNRTMNTSNWGGAWQDMGPHSTTDMAIGRLEHVVVDPDDATGNTVYVSSTTGGIFKTTDGGMNWANFNTDFAFSTTGVTCMTMIKDPVTLVKYLYIAVGGAPEDPPFNGIYRIQIGTTTWQNLTSNLSTLIVGTMNCEVNKILIDPTNLSKMYLATSIGVFYTCTSPPANPGSCTAMWNQITSFSVPIMGIAFDYSDPTYNSLYFSGANLWYTNNVTYGLIMMNCTNYPATSCWGSIWNSFANVPSTVPLPVPTPTSSFINISTNPTYPNNVFMFVKYDNAGQLIQYDKTQTFPNNYKLLYTSKGVEHNDKIYVKNSSFHPNLIVFPIQPVYGGMAGVYDLSSNSLIGNAAVGHDDTHDFDFSSNKLYATCDGGISTLSSPYTSSNFTSINGTGLGVARITNHSIYEKTGNDAILGLYDNGTKISNNLYTGNTWNYVAGGDGGECQFLNNKDYYFSYQGAHFYTYTTSTSPATSFIGKSCTNFVEAFLGTFRSIDGNKSIYHSGHELDYNNDPANSTNCTPPPFIAEVGWIQLSNFQTLLAQPNYCTSAFVYDMSVSSDNKTIYVAYLNNELTTSPCTTNNQPQAPNFQVLWKSTTGGLNNPNVSPPCTGVCWTALGSINSLLLIGTVKAVCQNPNNANEFWAGCSGYYDPNTWFPTLNRRVIHSTDGGATFSDYSTGLPNFPINKLIYRNGTDGEIYAATDVGVYYRSKNMSTWQIVGTNLPNIRVFDLQIDNCSQKIYAGTGGRGLWQLDLPVPTNPLALPTQVITQTVTMTGTQFYFNNFRVPNLCKLIISNANIYMGAKTSIVVDPGGQLVITNSTIQSFCDKKMWHGIQVKGNPALALYYDPVNLYYVNHGTAIISNSTIQDADVAAVNLGGYDLLTTAYICETGGGQVFASNSNFTNNRIDLNFWPYSFKNKSYARVCTLQVTDQLKDATVLPVARVNAWDVNGMNFLGCNFQNIAASNANGGVLGNGITSNTSSYLVANYCGGLACLTNPNGGPVTQFNNFTYGIDAVGVGSQLKTVTVRNTNFNNNLRGAYIGGTDYASFWQCNFTNIPGSALTIPPSTLGLPNSKTYGLYFDGSSNFFCENNTFSGVPTGIKIGCVVNNSQYNASRVYNCDFSNLSLACGAFNDNLDNSSYNGLVYNCDKYTSNSYDIGILSSPLTNPNTDISLVQGYWASTTYNSLVRNLYSAFCVTGQNNEYYSNKISTSTMDHANHTTQSGNGGTYNTGPPNTCKSPLVIVNPITGNFTRNTTTCPSINPNGGIVTSSNPYNPNLPNINGLISSGKVQYQTQNAGLAAASSPDLMATVGSSSNFPSLKSILLSNSPYLSDTILKLYFRKTGIPSADVVSIHLANAPVSAPVWQTIQALGLASSYMNQIVTNQNANLISARTQQQGIVNDILKTLQINYNSKVRILQADTTIVSINDSIKAAISNPYFGDYDVKLANFYIDVKDWTNATAQVNSIVTNKPAYAAWGTFKTAEISLFQNSCNIINLPSQLTLKTTLENYAASSDPAAVQAQSILKIGANENFWELTLLPAGIAGKSATENTADDVKIQIPADTDTKDYYLMAVPNPAINEVNINYKLPEQISVAAISILDVTGRVVYQTDVINSLRNILIQTDKWAAGIYYINLLVNKGILISKPLIIMK